MTPPRLSTAAVALCCVAVSACQTTTSRVAPTLDPIVVPTFESTKPIAFRKIVLKVPRHRPIGEISVGALCLRVDDMTVSGGRHQLDTDQFNDLFRAELENANYKVVGDPDALFEDPEINSAEYFIAGLISNIEANVCYPLAGFGNFRTSSAAVYMDVEWQIYDTLQRKVVRKIETQGSSNVSSSANGVDVAFDYAFSLAAQNLLADEGFYRLVRPDDGEPESTPEWEASESRQVTASEVQGLANLVGGPAITADGQIDIDQLNSAVAIVRSATGHGSGFVISKGLVLTNEHVIGGATKVRLIFGDGAQIDAEVAAVDDVRDVALIRFADSFIRPPLAIRLSTVKAGEDVYSFGAPLGEEFSGTLRKGIVSAHREIRDLNYIQSDVAINPGNSGGPLIDRNGNVVGIAVSGIMIAGVAEQGINFFIPIEEAVAALGL